MVLDITRFKGGSQKCIDILKNDHKWSFFNINYTFLFVYTQKHSCLTNMVYAMDSNNSVIKRLWCINKYAIHCGEIEHNNEKTNASTM